MSPAMTALANAARRRCPRCGARLFDGWFRIKPVCPECRLLTDRGEDDYFLGALMLNVIAGELVALVGAATAIAVTLPKPAWNLTLAIGLSLAVIAPLAGYPFAKSLWLAVDMQFRPPVTAGDSVADA